jgi:hypothetical protein
MLLLSRRDEIIFCPPGNTKGIFQSYYSSLLICAIGAEVCDLPAGRRNDADSSNDDG